MFLSLYFLFAKRRKSNTLCSNAFKFPVFYKVITFGLQDTHCLAKIIKIGVCYFFVLPTHTFYLLYTILLYFYVAIITLLSSHLLQSRYFLLSVMLLLVIFT